MATAKTINRESDEVCESLANSGAIVDRDASLIRGVKILGFTSKNKRTYPPEIVRQSVEQYEGKRVNLDHPDANQLGKPRSVRDRFGTLTGVRFVEGKGLFADLKFNPKHAAADQITWAAENDAGSIGFSHNATVKTRQGNDGNVVVEGILSVRHVDIVADPATTDGVFEHDTFKTTEGDDMDFTKVTLEDLKANRPDIVDAIEWAKANEFAEQTKELASLKAADAKRQKQAVIEAELKAAKLDPADAKHCSAVFLEQLNALEDEQARKSLIDDRAVLVLESKTDKAPQKPFTVTNTTESVTPLTRQEILAAFRR